MFVQQTFGKNKMSVIYVDKYIFCKQPITKIIQLDVNHGFDNIRPILNIY